MIVHYGYADGSGDYFIIINTDECDGCGKCVEACPYDVLELEEDDYGDIVVKVKDEIKSKVGYVCPGFNPGCSKNDVNCRAVCERDVISHTW